MGQMGVTVIAFIPSWGIGETVEPVGVATINPSPGDHHLTVDFQNRCNHAVS